MCCTIYLDSAQILLYTRHDVLLHLIRPDMWQTSLPLRNAVQSSGTRDNDDYKQKSAIHVAGWFATEKSCNIEYKPEMK